jgi:hypothetical protein
LKGATILFSEMSPDLDWEDDFNKWYDTHRIPQRMCVPGFLSAQRYRNAERPNYLAVYELESAGTLESEAYLKVDAQPHATTRWMLNNVQGQTRYLASQINEAMRTGKAEDHLDAPVIYAVFFSVPDERAAEFNEWYDTERVPMLLHCEDWLMVRRFEVYEGDPQPWTHLAVSYLADMAALDSPELDAARNSDWCKRLSEEPWFQASYLIFERHGDRFLPEED